jgi:hypothetical protein
MRARARFHPDQTRREFLEKPHQLISGQLPTYDYPLDTIHAMRLEHVLCHVQPNACKLHLGLLLLGDRLITPPVWHIPMPLRQEESIPLTYAGFGTA